MSSPVPTPAFPPAPETGQHDLFCPHCSYNLRGIESERCPECGRPFDRAALRVSRIPWVHRRQIGRVRAFVQTVWLASFQPGKLAEEINWSVSYSEAQRFRQAVILLNFLPVVLLAGVLYGVAWLKTGHLALSAVVNLGVATSFVGEPCDVLVVLGAWLLFLLGMTGAHTYWFHPRRLPVVHQNRGVALAYYACAPLALLPLVAGVIVGVALARDIVEGYLGSTGIIIWAAWAWFFFRAWPLGYLWFLWSVPLWLLRRTAHCSGGRMAAAAVLIPTLWVAVTVLTLGLVPLTVFGAAVVYYSLW